MSLFFPLLVFIDFITYILSFPQTPTPQEFSISGVVLREGCATSLNTHIQAPGGEKARLSLSLECHPHFSLRGSVQRSMEAEPTRAVPTHRAPVLAFSAVTPPGGVELGLDLGECRFRTLLGQSRSPEMQRSQSAYAFNVSHHCPALQVGGVVRRKVGRR